MNFNDLEHKLLKQIAKYYNLHNTIKRYTKLSKKELIAELEKHLFVDDEGIVLYIDKEVLLDENQMSNLKLKNKTVAELRAMAKQKGISINMLVNGKTKKKTKAMLLQELTKQPKPQKPQKPQQDANELTAEEKAELERK